MAAFGDGIGYSEGSHFTEDEGTDWDPTFSFPTSVAEVRAYQFEPLVPAVLAMEQPIDNVSVLVTHPIVVEESVVSDWCDCGKCANMPLPVNNYCCRRNRNFVAKIDANNDKFPHIHANCYTEIEALPFLLHPECLLNTYIKWCSYANARKKKLPTYNEVDINRRNRFCAYRDVTTHVYRTLGEKMRKPLPACVETHIKNLFPDPTGSYVGFLEWMPDA